jgi:hypothetical protein
MKLFNTVKGIVIHYENNFFLSKEQSWDVFVNRDQLYNHVFNEIAEVKPDASLAEIVNKNQSPPSAHKRYGHRMFTLPKPGAEEDDELFGKGKS